MTNPTSWNDELEGWTNHNEAKALAAQCEPRAEALVLGLVEGCWLEAEEIEADGHEAEAWEITDGSGMFLLFPIEATDNEGDDELPAPVGHVWVYAR